MKKTHTHLGIKLWIRKKVILLKKSVPDFLTNWNGLFNLIIAIAGVFLTIIGLNLSRKSNQYSRTALLLTQNDTSQQAQIKRLNEVVISQEEQTKTLINILKRLESQDSSLKVEIKQLEILTKGTIQQNELIKVDVKESQQISKSISSQLKINQKFEERQNREEINKKKIAKSQLFFTYLEIGDSLAVYRTHVVPVENKVSDAKYRSAWNERTKTLIRKILFLLKQEINNEILLSDSSLKITWDKCIDDMVLVSKLFFYKDPDTFDNMHDIYRKLADAHNNFTKFGIQYKSVFK